MESVLTKNTSPLCNTQGTMSLKILPTGVVGVGQGSGEMADREAFIFPFGQAAVNNGYIGITMFH